MARATIQEALDAAVASVARLPEPAEAVPLAPLPLAASVVAIALAALAFAALAAAAGVLVLFAALGRDGFGDLMIDARFDPAMKARIAAFAVSAIYGGVALATLAAARLRGPRGAWPRLLAAGPAARRRGGAPVVALAALAYALGFTLIQIAGRDRPPILAGPTDFVLLGTLAANLVVLAPLAEELFFRGWLYTGLRARWRFLPSYLVTVAAFAAIHLGADHRHWLRVLPLALAVGLVRELTGSLRPAIALHAAYNLVIVALTLAAA